MRRRRAERCLLRADVALEAGFVDDAREALEEARRLAPGVGGLSDLETRIAAVSPAVTESSRAPHSRVLPIAVAALLAIAGAIVAMTIVRFAVPRSASTSPSVPHPLESRVIPALLSSAPLAHEPPPPAAVSPAIDRAATPADDAARVGPSSERTETRAYSGGEPILLTAAADMPAPAIPQVAADAIISGTGAKAPEPPPAAAAELTVSNAVPLPSA